MRLALVSLAIGLLTATPAGARDRWPLWPSELTRIAAPLHAGPGIGVPEAHKLQALRALERYPDALVAGLILEALGDSTASIRREALQSCLERTMLACVPQALVQWQDEAGDPGVRIAALRVVALAGTAHLTLMLAALRDPEEAVRAEAAYTLARVPWPADQASRVCTALIGKLVDTAPPVRRAAARSLGLLGPAPVGAAGRVADPAPLALARLLTDPDPQVRQDAAEALGQLRDPRAAPPLLRALEAGDEVHVSRQMILALATLPGPEVDAALLRLLDAPPRGLTYRNGAEALGRRPTPSEALVDGLVARLREEALQPFILEILLMHGAAAAPALRVARARGLEPALDLAVDRLLAALEPPTHAPPIPAWPAADDRDEWQLRLRAPDALAAAAALADASPAWLGAAAAGALALPHGPAQRRAWLLALAASTVYLPADDAVTPAHLAGWVTDPGLAPIDRCLALAGLGRVDRAHADLRDETHAAAASDRDPTMRGCAATTTRDAPTLAGLLHDPSPRVRALASFTLAACPIEIPRDTHAELARLAHADPHPGVTRAARAALTRPPRIDRCRMQRVDLAGASASDGLGPGWVDLLWRGQPLRLPVLPVGTRRWLVLPGTEPATVLPNTGA